MIRLQGQPNRPVAELSTAEIRYTLDLIARGQGRCTDDDTHDNVRERLLIELRIRELGL